jgi:hypothetical protein
MITVLEERPAGAPSNGHGLSSPGHQPQHGGKRSFHDVVDLLHVTQRP